MTVKKTEDTNMDTADLRSRVVALEQGAQAIVPRVTALEQWQRGKDIAEAGREAQWTAMIDRFNERFTSLEQQIGKIAGTLTFLSRTFIGAVILAFVAFLIQGGLHVP